MLLPLRTEAGHGGDAVAAVLQGTTRLHAVAPVRGNRCGVLPEPRNAPGMGIDGGACPTLRRPFPSNHHLSAAQALSVYNSLMQRGTIAAQQLFVIGHGANHPVVSNATDAGRARNRRVEFVVYPERMASR